MWVRGAIAWGLFLPGSWLAVRHYETGDLGLALSLMGYLALLAAVLYLRFRSGAWRRIELVEPSPVS
jgi:MATE family multidrug resistance protein